MEQALNQNVMLITFNCKEIAKTENLPFSTAKKIQPITYMFSR